MPTTLVSSGGSQAQGVGDCLITVVTDGEDLRALRTEWTALLLDSRQPSVFLSWEWMTTWLQNHDGQGTPFVLLIRRARDQQLIGLAPLYRIASKHPFGLLTISFLGTGVGADHFAFVSRTGLESEVTALLTDFLVAGTQWDVLSFSRVEEKFATNLAEMISREARAETAASLDEADPCPFIQLPRTWEDFLRIIGSKKRKELARRWRRLQEQGDVAIRRVETARELESAWGILLRLHQSRRQAVGGKSAFATAGSEAFHGEFLGVALERGWLRFYLMLVRGQCVAAEYCLSLGDRVTDFQGGFDVRWSPFSVGTLLIAHAIREAILGGALEFDFLRGAEPYKLEWGAVARKDLSLLVWKRHPRVELVMAARRRGDWLRRRLRQQLGTS